MKEKTNSTTNFVLQKSTCLSEIEETLRQQQNLNDNYILIVRRKNGHERLLNTIDGIEEFESSSSLAECGIDRYTSLFYVRPFLNVTYVNKVGKKSSTDT